MLIVASYVFYAFWSWKFLFLLMFSTALDFFCGSKIYSDTKRKKFWLIFTVTTNLGFLGIFKYYNFFIANFIVLLEAIGWSVNIPLLQVIIPVGISFYTFHGMSYVFDIYNGKIKPSNNIIEYALFVSYFPLLVAGPIERATHLLPQLENKRIFTYDQAVLGLRQMLWGLFKKMVIADNCAPVVNMIFAENETATASTLLLGALLFAFQIYGDFSGYTDIALGTSKLFGIELLKNFNYPYFSRSIAEFWRRWHISLSSWFRDYLYIPMGGSRGNKLQTIRNVFIIFLVSGFWHGANWTFIVWGLIHALMIIPSVYFHKNREHLDVVALDRTLPNLKELAQMFQTFVVVVIAWIFFRAESLSHAWMYLKGICSSSIFSIPMVSTSVKIALFFSVIMFLVEWLSRKDNFGLETLLDRLNKPIRWIVYMLLCFVIILWAGEEEKFIYFQF